MNNPLDTKLDESVNGENPRSYMRIRGYIVIPDIMQPQRSYAFGGKVDAAPN